MFGMICRPDTDQLASFVKKKEIRITRESLVLIYYCILHFASQRSSVVGCPLCHITKGNTCGLYRRSRDASDFFNKKFLIICETLFNVDH